MIVSKSTLKKRNRIKNIQNFLCNESYSDLLSFQEASDLSMDNLNHAGKIYSGKLKKRKLIQERAKYRSELEEKLFVEAVFSVFKEALVLDEDYKEEREDELFQLCEQTIQAYFKDNNTSLNKLKNRNGLLESLVVLCEEISNDEAKEKFSNDDVLNELDDEKDEDFEISDESKDKFEDEKENLGIQLVDEIKTKVLETIEKEQQIANSKKDLDEEIKSFSKELSSDTPEATTAGEMTGGVENYDDSSDSEEYAPEAEVKDTQAPAVKSQGLEEAIKFEFYNPTKKLNIKKSKKLQENTLFGNILKATANKYVKHATLNESVNVNMDNVFAESITMLTLIESLQFIGITEFNNRELREFGKNLVADSKK